MQPQLSFDQMVDEMNRQSAAEQLTILRNGALPAAYLAQLEEIHASAPGRFPDRMHQILTGPKVPRELFALAAFGEGIVWAEDAASNPALPSDIAAELLRTGSARVRERVILSTSTAVLSTHDWSAEISTRVLVGAVSRGHSPQKLRLDDATTRVVIDQLMRVSTSERSLTVAARYSRDAGQLLVLCQDAREAVREQAATNSACPEEGKVLAALMS